jgi:hypothetical protein
MYLDSTEQVVIPYVDTWISNSYTIITKHIIIFNIIIMPI